MDCIPDSSWLEDENRQLREQNDELAQACRHLVGRNKLYGAKIGELNARLLNPNHSAVKHRSPLPRVYGGVASSAPSGLRYVGVKVERKDLAA